MDQLLNLGRKFLLPISLGNLLLTTSSQLLSLFLVVFCIYCLFSTQ